jgi:hypothetical protein
MALLILAGLFVCTVAAVAFIQRSIPAGLLTVAMGSLVLALLVLGYAAGPEWPRQPLLERWERLGVLWLMAATGCAGVVLLVVGVATHHGSWVIGLIGFTAAIAAGVIAVRAFLQDEAHDAPDGGCGGCRVPGSRS